MIVAQSEAYGRTNDQSFEMAWKRLVERNPFPAVCGRVCPHPCEDACNRKDKDGAAVPINAVERFIGDFGISKKLQLARLNEKPKPKRSRYGRRPGGPLLRLSAGAPRLQGHGVRGFPKAGGMLRYGIPRYRLPREVLDAEIQRILDLGVELKCNSWSAETLRWNSSASDYQAVFVGIGAQKGLKLRIPGEDAPNVFSGTEFLNRGKQRREGRRSAER